MTNDELRTVIARGLADDDMVTGITNYDNTDAVLAAIRGAGVVIGERVTYEGFTDAEFSGLDGVIDGDPDTFEGIMDLFAEFGLALVRVVAND